MTISTAASLTTCKAAFPVSERPFLEAAQTLGIGERDLIDRLEHLQRRRTVPVRAMYHAERLGGGLTLAALAAPRSASTRWRHWSTLPRGGDNYERDHALNMWPVIATERPKEIGRVLAEISAETGLLVHDMPKPGGSSSA